jgi:hypothetical protein
LAISGSIFDLVVGSSAIDRVPLLRTIGVGSSSKIVLVFS